MKDPDIQASEAERLAYELLGFAADLRRGAAGCTAAAAQARESDKVVAIALPSGPATKRHAALAKKMYRARRLRDMHLPRELFGEPAWDMLLELYSAMIEARPLNITSVQIASGVPETTAFRYLLTLEERGLIERYDKGTDRRVKYVRLTEEAARVLNRYFRRLEMEVSDSRGEFRLRGVN